MLTQGPIVVSGYKAKNKYKARLVAK